MTTQLDKLKRTRAIATRMQVELTTVKVAPEFSGDISAAKDDLSRVISRIDFIIFSEESK
jgi:hypothetical protein